MIEEPKNSLKSEHLDDGVSPIIACIGTPEQFKRYPGEEQGALEDIDANTNNSQKKNIDYYGNPRDLKKQNFKNAGENSYVISSIDSSSKYSKSFRNCTGLVVTGKDKKTGENISFLSHEDPGYFLKAWKNQVFIDDLREQLSALKERSVEGTIDAVIVGGNYFKNGVFDEAKVWGREEEFRDAYLTSIKLLSSEVFRALGFEPVVMTGPKTEVDGGGDSVFYDNEHRRLYIMRKEIGKDATKSYVPSAIKKQEKNW